MTGEENSMSTDVKLAKQAIHDKLESQINTAEAKLKTLKARSDGEGERRAQSNHRAPDQEADDRAQAAGVEEVGWRSVRAGESRYRGTNHRS